MTDPKTIFVLLDGVLDFINHEDIPGDNCVKNNKKNPDGSFKYPEKLFATHHIHYAGQAVGLIIATTSDIAHRAARMVQITYKDVKKPLLNIKDVIKSEELGRISSESVGDPIIVGDVESEFRVGADVVSGEFQIGSQYHFHLETQTCIVTPEEDGVSVISTTQYMDAGVMRRDISYLI